MTIKATDADLIAQKQTVEDTSCNQIKCDVVAVNLGPDNIVQCEVELLSSGEYDVLLSLTQRIDNPDLGLGDTYTFQIVAKVIFGHEIHWQFNKSL